MQACSNGLAALRARERCPSDGLQQAVLQLILRAEELGASSRTQELTAQGLRDLREQAAPLLRSLASALQRFDTEVSARASIHIPGAPLPPADLYTDALRAVRSLAQLPALAAALEGEAAHGGQAGTVHVLLETLLIQMLSLGVRCTAADPTALQEEHLWLTVAALLEAAPAACAAALLHLSNPKGCSTLVSTRLQGEEHPRALQAEVNVLVGRALAALAGQAPFLLHRSDAAKLAPLLNERVGQHCAPGRRAEEWCRLWAPVRSGLEALLYALMAAGPQDKSLYSLFKKELPPYTPGKNRPPLLSLMNGRYETLRQEGQEARLHRILLACGRKDTERLGLLQLHDFVVEHHTWVAMLFASLPDDTPWALMVRRYVAAAQRPGVRTALMEGATGAAAAVGKPRVARTLDVNAGQPLAPLDSNAAAAPPRPAAAACDEPPVARALAPALAAEAAAPAPRAQALTGRLADLLQPEPGVLRTPRGLLRMARACASRLRAPTNLGGGAR